jgi:hypothetical protein
MKYSLNTIHSPVPRFALDVGQYTFYNGLHVEFVFWKIGLELIITTDQAFADYKASMIQKANALARRLNEEENE